MARLSATGLLALLLLRQIRPRHDESPETFFELKVRPVLVTNCLPCHGGKKTSSGLKVDSRDSLLRGGDRGPAIVPGEPGKSLLIQAIRRTDDDLKMPPDRALPEESIGALADWVAEVHRGPKRRPRKPPAGETSGPALGVRESQGRRATARIQAAGRARRSIASSRPGGERQGSRPSGGQTSAP